MSLVERVTRVAQVVGPFRLTAALRAIGLPRATWYRHQRRRAYAEKYGHLREALEQIARIPSMATVGSPWSCSGPGDRR